MATITPTATNNLRQLTRKNLKIGSLILGIGLMLGLLFMMLASGNLKNYQTSQEELSQLKVTEWQDQQLYSYIETNQEQLEVLAAVFPNQDTMPDVFMALESLVGNYDQQGAVQFTSSVDKPVKTVEGTFLSMKISMQISDNQIPAFFRDIERLPLLVKITDFEIQHIGEGYSDLRVGANLFVDDDYAK